MLRPCLKIRTGNPLLGCTTISSVSLTGFSSIRNIHPPTQRIWSHGIHSFLEILKRHLPASGNCMVSFAWLAYSTMAALLRNSLV
jgi:hypothetical protein